LKNKILRNWKISIHFHTANQSFCFGFCGQLTAGLVEWNNSLQQFRPKYSNTGNVLRLIINYTVQQHRSASESSASHSLSEKTVFTEGYYLHYEEHIETDNLFVVENMVDGVVVGLITQV
jgi:hypothetical protein